MKTGKKLLAGLVGVVVILAICVACVFFFINSIAKAGIEKGGTYALGVPTRVGSADVGVFSGTFDMSDFQVDNPPGFASPHFLSLGKGDVAVSLGTLMKDLVELPKLELDTLDVRLEKKDGKSNYNVILENLKKISGGDSGGGGGKPAPAPQPAPQGKSAEKRYIVQDLSVRNVMVHVDLLGGGAMKVTVPIDEIKMQNVGKTGSGVGGTGVTMGQLSGIIVKAVLAAAVQKGGDLIPSDVLGELQGGLAGLGGLGGSVEQMGLSVVGNAKGSVEKIGGEVKKAEEDVKKSEEEAKKKAEEIQKGIKGLLPGKKN